MTTTGNHGSSIQRDLFGAPAPRWASARAAWRPRFRAEIIVQPSPLLDPLQGRRRRAVWRPRFRAEAIAQPVPLLDPLQERRGRGRPTERPIGMPQNLWFFWRRWAARHGRTDNGALREFLAANALHTARQRASAMSPAVIAGKAVYEWVLVKPWIDLTPAEVTLWRERIAAGKTGGTYKISLRGLQCLEAKR